MKALALLLVMALPAWAEEAGQALSATAEAQALSPVAEAQADTVQAALLAPALPKAHRTASYVVERLVKRQDQMGALSCRVRREERPETDPSAQPRVVEGRLWAASGGRARFDLGQGQLMVSDGKTLWIALPEARQVLRQEASSLKTGGQFFLDLPNSIRYYARTSKAALAPLGPGYDPKKAVAVELRPLDPDAAGFERVKVWVDTERWLARQAEMHAGGLLVRVRFLDLKAYSKAEVKAQPKRQLPAKLFRYTPPKDFEVFDSLVP